MITYSFIIPHHNCPKLLDRCINSIPQRDDIQIIVVDDNSDEEKKPIQCDRPEVEYIYINKEESKGAGRARNRGLEKAKGKWIVFSDSDDFFNSELLNNKLDIYKKSDADIIFFNTNKLNADTLKPVKENYKYSEVVNKNNAESIEWLRYRSNVPWGKFINKMLITKHNLCFSECIAGNDLYFSLTSGHFSQKTIIDTDTIYYWCIRSVGNISSNKSKEAILSKYKQTKLRNQFLISVDKKDWVSNIFSQYFTYFRLMGFSYKVIFYTLWNDTPKQYRIKHFIKALNKFLIRRLCV